MTFRRIGIILATAAGLCVHLHASDNGNDPILPRTASVINRSTLAHKVMCGYQGWHAVLTDAIGRGWYHYKDSKTGRFEPGYCKFDLWPDMSEMDPDEKSAAPGFVTASGAQAYVYSAQNRKTVVRHFKWMSDYGIDGVFIQRFATEVAGNGLTQWNNVLDNCRAGANQYGRVFAVMYDLSGMKLGDWKKVLTDFRTQIVAKNVLKDSMYLYHKGKPVVAVWGIGFNDGRLYTESECSELIDSLKNHPQYGGNTVMVGVPTYWRTLTRDALPDTTLLTIIKKSDIVSPWFVTRVTGTDKVYNFAQNVVAGDVTWCNQWGVDYLPVVSPGFSFHNSDSTSVLNKIPRDGGRFLWRQFYEYLRCGSTMIYQAMFDEIDEGTAIYKCTNDPPVGASTFITYEGLPSDQYLWLVGQASRVVRGEIASTQEPPSRTLPVEISSFSVSALPGGAQITWSTATEVNCRGFEIERRTNGSVDGEEEWKTITFIEAAGTSNAAHSYSFRDRTARSGAYTYRLKQIDQDGSIAYYGNERVEIGVPHEFHLFGNYPNPFNPSTTLRFSVAGDANAEVKIFNTLGAEVAAVFNGPASAGTLYATTFNASALPSGVYLARLRSNGASAVVKMMLVK